MLRVVLFLIGVVAIAAGLSWLAEQPGTILLTFGDYEIQTSLFRAVVMLALALGFALFAWSVLRQIWSTPAAVGQFINRRRQARGLDALSSGMIAIGAGDKKLALRYAGEARKSLPNEPLTHLLRAQAAQLSGDRATSRRIFEAMLGSPDTEQLGLRGLFLEAQRENEPEAARQFAERALELNPKLTWPFDSLFELQCKASDWAGALKTLATGTKNGQLEKPDADRRRALLLTAQAQALEDENGQKALDLALEAHNLAPDLVPAAVIAGRQLASRGSTPRAAKIIERTWKKSPHPDLSMVYAFARPGDAPRDRLDRIKRLARTAPHSSEGPIAVAGAAVEARKWDEARAALQPLLENQLSPRVCTLMARIEGGEKQNAGGVREWLARAVTAPRDPAWTADGMVSDSWAPISPVTGALDAFQWKVPLAMTPGTETPKSLDQLVEFAGLGGGARHGITGQSGAVAQSPVIGHAIEPKPAPVAAARRPDVIDVAAAVVNPSSAVTVTKGGMPAEHAAEHSKSASTGPVIVKAKPAPPVAAKPVAMATIATSANRAAPFVPPRPPDDPGLDGPGLDDRGSDGRDDLAKQTADYATKTQKRSTH